MKDFSGRLAVVTGGGSGMGRELVRQLAAEGCDVAFCDVVTENLEATRAQALGEGAQGVRVTAHACDVSDEEQVLRFRAEVLDQHGRDHVHLLFNNAGIGGVVSFVDGDRGDWERTFDICWKGVYLCSRAFVPLLVAAEEAHLINTSSVNGFWATLGPGSTHTAYAAAKFAVKGFSEALIHDLRANAPHVGVSVVMPGHIGTDIAINTGLVMGRNPPSAMTPEELEQRRRQMVARGLPAEELDDAQLRELLDQLGASFRDNAPVTAAEAAKVILDAVREKRWRVLVGRDAEVLDRMVRERPEDAYSDAFMEALRAQADWGLG